MSLKYLATTSLLTLALASAPVAADSTGDNRSTVRIGYAISLTGGNATGAGITVLPNYRLWAQEVNAAGGLNLWQTGQRLPVEIIEYDDRSSTEEAVRAIERLATQDQVDFILPTWGTGPNLATGPIFDRYGYPHITATATSDTAPQLAQRWPRSFWMLGVAEDYAHTLIDLVAAQRDAGVVNNRVTMIAVSDAFGIELRQAAVGALEEAGLEVVYNQSYPLGTSDFAPIINEIRGLEADTFIAFSYPPDTFALLQQAMVSQFNPSIFYTGVGTAFPVYLQTAGANAEGVMGIGGIDPDNQELAEYFARHEEVMGQSPDSWSSATNYATLQMLQQAIERVGAIDREAVSRELASGTFDTVIGPVQLENNQLRSLWTVGQWQDGQFVGIAHTLREGAREAAVPKPAWGASAE